MATPAAQRPDTPDNQPQGMLKVSMGKGEMRIAFQGLVTADTFNVHLAKLLHSSKGFGKLRLELGRAGGLDQECLVCLAKVLGDCDEAHQRIDLAGLPPGGAEALGQGPCQAALGPTWRQVHDRGVLSLRRPRAGAPAQTEHKNVGAIS